MRSIMLGFVVMAVTACTATELAREAPPADGQTELAAEVLALFGDGQDTNVSCIPGACCHIEAPGCECCCHISGACSCSCK